MKCRAVRCGWSGVRGACGAAGGRCCRALKRLQSEWGNGQCSVRWTHLCLTSQPSRNLLCLHLCPCILPPHPYSYLPAGDSAVVLGAGMDELLRHVPQLRPGEHFLLLVYFVSLGPFHGFEPVPPGCAQAGRSPVGPLLFVCLHRGFLAVLLLKCQRVQCLYSGGCAARRTSCFCGTNSGAAAAGANAACTAHTCCKGLSVFLRLGMHGLPR